MWGVIESAIVAASIGQTGALMSGDIYTRGMCSPPATGVGMGMPEIAYSPSYSVSWANNPLLFSYGRHDTRMTSDNGSTFKLLTAAQQAEGTRDGIAGARLSRGFGGAGTPMGAVGRNCTSSCATSSPMSTGEMSIRAVQKMLVPAGARVPAPRAGRFSVLSSAESGATRMGLCVGDISACQLP